MIDHVMREFIYLNVTALHYFIGLVGVMVFWAIESSRNLCAVFYGVGGRIPVTM